MQTKPGGVRVGIDVPQTYKQYLADGLVATDGAQYSAVVSFGTTNTEILSVLVDPGYAMGLRRLEFHGIPQFTGLNGSFVASILFWWTINKEYTEVSGASGPYKVTGSDIPVSGTFQVAAGTLTSLSPTLTGYVAVGTIDRAPLRVKLKATGIQAGIATGRVHNASYIELVGNVIPGA